MEREKRKTTVPVPYEIPLVCYPRIRERTRKKAKAKPCKYEPIPLPLKFAYVGGVYHFYGGVSLREHNGLLTTEEVMLSYFKCEEVTVIKKPDQKIVNIKLEKPPAFQYPPWQPMVKKLKASEHSYMRDWGRLTEDYCLKFEDWLRALSNREEFLKRWSEADLMKMTEEAEQKKAEYFSKYPCFSCIAAGDISQLDITVNEAYLAYAGYDLETFATTTLRDGLPQLLPLNYINPVKLYMENFKTSGLSECITPELELELAVRKGFNRKINCKTHFFFTYRNGNFAAELAYIIIDKGQPNFYTPALPRPPLNKTFLRTAKKHEKQAKQFLEKYYNTNIVSGYANMDKVCGIKELPPDNSNFNDQF